MCTYPCQPQSGWFNPTTNGPRSLTTRFPDWRTKSLRRFNKCSQKPRNANKPQLISGYNRRPPALPQYTHRHRTSRPRFISITTIVTSVFIYRKYKLILSLQKRVFKWETGDFLKLWKPERRSRFLRLATQSLGFGSLEWWGWGVLKCQNVQAVTRFSPFDLCFDGF